MRDTRALGGDMLCDNDIQCAGEDLFQGNAASEFSKTSSLKQQIKYGEIEMPRNWTHGVVLLCLYFVVLQQQSLLHKCFRGRTSAWSVGVGSSMPNRPTQKAKTKWYQLLRTRFQFACICALYTGHVKKPDVSVDMRAIAHGFISIYFFISSGNIKYNITKYVSLD